MISLLLDTHTPLWFLWDDPHLSDRARGAIEVPANRKLVSVATCWEIGIKAGLGKLRLGEPSGVFLERELARNHFELLPITLEQATSVETLARHHKDPFDRLLVVQAMTDALCTRDCQR